MSDSPAPQSGVTNTNEKSGKVEETAASDHNIALLSMPAPICTRNSNHSLSGKRREPYSGAAGPSLFPMPADHDQNEVPLPYKPRTKSKRNAKKELRIILRTRLLIPTHASFASRAANTIMLFKSILLGLEDGCTEKTWAERMIWSRFGPSLNSRVAKLK